MKTGWFDADFGAMLTQSALLCVPVSALVALLCAGLRALGKQTVTDAGTVLDIITPSFSARNVGLFTLVMLLFWGIYIVGFCPGTMNFDTFYQLYQLFPENHPIMSIQWTVTQSYVDNYFSDHNPIFDTLLFGLFVVPSQALTGNWNSGIFVYVFLQCVATAATYCLGLAYLKKRGAAPVACLVAFAVFCLVPFFPIDAMTMLKDTLFSWLFVLYWLCIVEIVFTRGQALRCGKLFAAFLVLSVLLVLTKITGGIQVCAAAFVFMFVFRAQWKRWLICLVVPAVTIYAVVPWVVFPLLDVAPGGIQEALSVPFQQTARYVVEHESEVTPSEREAIDAVLDYDTLENRYRPLDTDTVKFEWNYRTATSDDMRAYLAVWCEQGLKHPETYAQATGVIALGYVAPYYTVFAHVEQGKNVDERCDLAWFPSETGHVRQMVTSFYHYWQNHVPLNGLMLMVLYSWWLPMLGWTCALMKRRGYGWMFLPLALALAAAMPAPIINARYVYPLLSVAPLIPCLATAFWSKHADRMPKRTFRNAKHAR